MTKRLLIALAAIALASFALAACGGDDSESSSTSAEETSAPAGDGATIAVEADPGGSLAFVETDLSTEAGSDTVELTNDSETPHDVVIEDADGNEIAATDTVSGDTATASADLEAGSYTFFCSVPGHREAGMEGTLTVK